MKKHIYILTTLLFVFTSCSNKKNIEFKTDQKAFAQSIAMILKSNSNDYKRIYDNRNAEIDSNIIKKNLAEMTIAYNDIINESKKVSDKFLDYIDSDLKDRYRSLINIYKTTLDLIHSDNYDSEKNKKIEAENYATEEAFWNLFEEKQSNFENKLSGFKQDFKDAMKKYNVPVEEEKQNDSNKSYGRMFLRLFLGSLILAVVYAVFGFISIIILSLIIKGKEKMNITIFATCQIAHIVQLYIWLLWVSFCVYSLKYYVSSPAVTHAWIYYVTGFAASIFLIGLLMQGLDDMKTKRNLTVLENAQLFIVGPSTSTLLIIISFVLFCIFPSWMDNNFISFINNWIYN